MTSNPKLTSQELYIYKDYRTKINELLLDIFKKIKPISSDKLITLVKKHYK